jgi:hypothetical protein
VIREDLIELNLGRGGESKIKLERKCGTPPDFRV